MKFGVFDHMDRAGGDLHRQFDERLSLIELYERAGRWSTPSTSIIRCA